MLRFLNPGGPRQGVALWGGQNIDSHFTMVYCHCKPPHYLYHVGGGESKGEEKKGEEERIDTIFQWEPGLNSLTGAFHVYHSKLPGLNTGLYTHWEHYCYRKMKASTSLRKLGLYYAFPFSTVIIYPPFFSRTLLNSSKNTGSTCGYRFISGTVSSWCLKENGNDRSVWRGLKQVQTHSTALLRGKHMKAGRNGHSFGKSCTRIIPVLADSEHCQPHLF